MAIRARRVGSAPPGLAGECRFDISSLAIARGFLFY